MTPEIRNLLKEARTIIRAHARWSAKDWDERATKALATPPQRTKQEPLIGCVNHDCDRCKPLEQGEKND